MAWMAYNCGPSGRIYNRWRIKDENGALVAKVAERGHDECVIAHQIAALPSLLAACKAGLHEWSLHEKADENAARLCEMMRDALAETDPASLPRR